MKPITDEDLILLYYGEHEEAGLASRVAESPELSARFDALSADLGGLDAYLPPERGDDYGAELWQKISPSLSAAQNTSDGPMKSWFSGMLQPRFSLAGALSLTLIAALAFTVGRQQEQAGNIQAPLPVVAQTSPLEIAAGARVLTSSVSAHLEQLNVELTQFANLDSGYAPDAEHATELLVANRLYRSAAAAQGKTQLASFLAELEPLLVELAYEAYKNSPQTHQRLQNEIRENLLFRVRLMNHQLGQTGIST